MPLEPSKRKRWLALATALLLGVGALALVVPNLSSGSAPTDGNGNSGTVKVHTTGDIGSERNDPHVACPFWVEGFGMEASSGTLWIKSWPPTGDKTTVLTDNWTSDSTDNDGNHHFLNGPYNLTSGHYKLFVTNGKHEKMKVFWVDCNPEIPFFPSPVALGVGALGALAGTFLIFRRKA